VGKLDPAQVAAGALDGPPDEAARERPAEAGEIRGSDQEHRRAALKQFRFQPVNQLIPILFFIQGESGHPGQNLAQGGIEVPLDCREKHVTDPVSREVEVLIGGVFAPMDASFTKEGPDLFAIDVEQGPHEPLGGDGKDARDAGDAGSAEQAEEHCFGLVRARVAEGDAVDQPLAEKPKQEFAPGTARRLLEVIAAGGGQPAHVHFGHVKRQAETHRHLAHEAGVLPGLLSAQAVIEMEHAQSQRPPGPQLDQRLEEAHGVSAARHRHSDSVAALEHAITRDGFGDAVEKALHRHLHCKSRRGRGTCAGRQPRVSRSERIVSKYDFGIIGLGVMGQNLALNIESRGFSVAGFDLDTGKARASEKKWAGKRMATVPSIQALADVLQTPHRILMMVPAGKPVDAVIQDLKPLLAAGDILIDGGNSFFVDTDRRGKELEAAGLRYIGMGVSGGEEGALHGPALMPGGPEEAYRLVEPILTSIAAKTDDGPCCAYIGKAGAGHYVKMVHNGMEYAIMQLICEAYDVMKSGLGMSAPEIQKVFAGWNGGPMNSYLIEITATVLAKTDSETGKPLVDVILDTAGQKGTGKWTSQNALDLGIAVPTINAALEGRILSAVKGERVAASRVLHGPDGRFEGDRGAALTKLHDALRISIIASYAQGFALMREASREYGYELDFPEIARIWKGGCIIRARLLDAIKKAFLADRALPNLLVDVGFAALVNELAGALRETVGLATRLGVPCLAFSASLGYVDAYRSERLPANLLQGQRDYFGAHKYERVDKRRGEFFHTNWTGGGPANTRTV